MILRSIKSVLSIDNQSISMLNIRPVVSAPLGQLASSLNLGEKLTVQPRAAPSYQSLASSSYSVGPFVPRFPVCHKLTPSAFGALFARHAEALVGSEEDPKDPGSVARLCYFAGFVYVGFLVFCGMQVG
jgi:hypothetical protein